MKHLKTIGRLSAIAILSLAFASCKKDNNGMNENPLMKPL